MYLGKSALLAVMLASVSTSVLGQDWIVDRLRGTVLQWEQGGWVPLKRGEIVPDGQQIRTGADGRADLVRGLERISLAGNTQIAVRDTAGQKMTSVIQTLGSVTVEAERRNVQHFSVQTPVLAAVVKGTKFTVTYSNGQARVEVESGVVQVQDPSHDIVVDVGRGQTAVASQSQPVDVTGPQSERAVFLIEGEVVPAVARAAVLKGALAAEDALGAVRDGDWRNGNAALNSNAGGSGNGNAVGNGNGSAGGNGTGSAGGNGNGGAHGGNAGGNGNSNVGGHGNPGAASGNGNAEGNSNGNAGGNSKAGGNGKNR